MKNSFLKFTIFFLILLSVSIIFNFLSSEIPEEKKEWEIGNEIIKIYYPVKFENGKVAVEDISLLCGDDDLPQENLIAHISKIGTVEHSTLGLLEFRTDSMPPQYEIIAANESEGHFAGIDLEQKPDNITVDGSVITVHYDEGDIEYRLIKDYFEPFSRKTRLLADPDWNFFMEIPKEWEKEKGSDSINFFHPKSERSYGVFLYKEDFSLHKSEDSPYEWEFEVMKRSLDFFDSVSLPDYGSMSENLDEYLEINTVERKIKLFKENDKFSFNVLAAGDPTGWNGTPGGLYRVLSKEGLRFSTESNVYMPFSVRIYGKYLLHGEAYYPSGIPYTSAISGGCVRVRNEEMIELYDLLEKDIPVLSITHIKESFPDREPDPADFPAITADSFLVADIDSGKVFASKNPNAERPIASIAKVMTSIIAVEHMGTTTPITVRDYMIEGTDQKIWSGRVVRMIDLLSPVLIESSNDATRVLSHYLGRDNTLEYMKQKAKSIGMKNTIFVEATGIDTGNISTAKDIYYLSYYLLNTRMPLLNITRGVWVPGINYQAFPGVKNKNIFYPNSQFIGGKTGYTQAAGYSGFFIFNIDFGSEVRRVSFVLLGSESEKDLEMEVSGLKKWLTDSYN